MQHQTAGAQVIDQQTQSWAGAKFFAMLAAYLGTFPLAEIHLVVSICTGIVLGALGCLNLWEKVQTLRGGRRGSK